MSKETRLMFLHDEADFENALLTSTFSKVLAIFPDAYLELVSSGRNIERSSIRLTPVYILWIKNRKFVISDVFKEQATIITPFVNLLLVELERLKLT